MKRSTRGRCLQIRACNATCLFLGRIDASEIQQSLAELGIDISKEDSLKILQRFGPLELFTARPLLLSVSGLTLCKCQSL